MSSQPGRPAERAYHQDYIARIRYENTMPPPPGAPKLLNIPIEGLNYYTSAAFASRMARQQPLNIEADAELGMPIDLVGMPGIFDGDESSIQAPLAIPPIHPKDKNLLRPLSELGKPKFSTGGHSFLRRTEYISSEAKARAEANAHAAKSASKSLSSKFMRRQTDASKEDPMNILRHTIKGFDLANPDDVYVGQDDSTHLRGAQPAPAEIEAWRRPRHPTKPDLSLIDSYPVKPDLDATTDQGAYIISKFSGNPTNSNNEHDIRMDVGLLNPIEKAPEDYDYEFYLLEDVESAKQMKRKYDCIDEGQGDESNPHSNKDGVPAFRYRHHRTYDVGRQANSIDQPYKEVALALHDPELDRRTGKGDAGERLSKGAYYYPIALKMQLKPRRNRNLANLGLQRKAVDEETERPDEIDLVLREPNEIEVERRTSHREELMPEAVAMNGA
ncbi:MAG: hypothetical protein Q9217_004128 [Psora testacea]